MEDELFNLDIYFAGIIAAKLREFKEQEAGYPSEYGNQESWSAKLDTIIIPLEKYSQKFDLNLGWNEEGELTRAAQRALKDFAGIFPALWI